MKWDRQNWRAYLVSRLGMKGEGKKGGGEEIDREGGDA